MGRLAGNLLRGAAQVRPRAVPYILRYLTSASFSLYGEDRILSGLQPVGRGFYCDVGAFHPIIGSNTYKLYLLGWRGITIEPNPAVADLFRAIRPWDTHLTIGIAATTGELAYHTFDNAMLNTCKLDDLAVRTNDPVKSSGTIACKPLAATLPPAQHVDFLNVDCEGMELAALRSLDWSVHRPTVICVENPEQYSMPYVGFSPIRVFMHERSYEVISQMLNSYLYLCNETVTRSEGFQIDQSLAKFFRRVLHDPSRDKGD